MLEITLYAKITDRTEFTGQQIMCSFEEDGYARTEFKRGSYIHIHWDPNNPARPHFWYTIYNCKVQWITQKKNSKWMIIQRQKNDFKWKVCDKPTNLEDMYEEVLKQKIVGQC